MIRAQIDRNFVALSEEYVKQYKKNRKVTHWIQSTASSIMFLVVLCCLFGVVADAKPAACEGCGKTINGRFVEVQGKSYHPDHFTCARCSLPIKTGKFFEEDGEYYDSVCFVKAFSKRCDHCGEPILGEAVTLNASVYHSSCYNDHVGQRCVVCRDVVKGEFLIGSRGGVVCNEHRPDALECHVCHTLLSPYLVDGGKRLTDGRVTCKECLVTSVSDPDLARTMMTEIASELAVIGIVIEQDFSLSFVSQPELKSHSNDYRVDQLAVTIYETNNLLGNLLSFDDFSILVLDGLPRAQLRAVLAHELMHVWMFANAPYPQDPQLCEGSCQFAAYKVLQNDNSEDGRFFLKLLMEQPGEVYGDGFRKVHKYVRERGLNSWLHYLRYNDEPPW